MATRSNDLLASFPWISLCLERGQSEGPRLQTFAASPTSHANDTGLGDLKTEQDSFQDPCFVRWGSNVAALEAPDIQFSLRPGEVFPGWVSLASIDVGVSNNQGVLM